MRTMVTLTVQKIITHKNEKDYEKKRDQLVKELEKEFDNVDVEAEDEETTYDVE